MLPMQVKFVQTLLFVEICILTKIITVMWWALHQILQSWVNVGLLWIIFCECFQILSHLNILFYYFKVISRQQHGRTTHLRSNVNAKHQLKVYIKEDWLHLSLLNSFNHKALCGTHNSIFMDFKIQMNVSLMMSFLYIEICWEINNIPWGQSGSCVAHKTPWYRHTPA